MELFDTSIFCLRRESRLALQPGLIGVYMWSPWTSHLMDDLMSTYDGFKTDSKPSDVLPYVSSQLYPCPTQTLGQTLGG